MRYSEDGGKTRGEQVVLPPLSNGKRVGFNKPLVEGETVTGISYYEGPAHGPTGWTAWSVLTRSLDGGRTWGDPILMPSQWCTSECVITRAQDGALVVAMRTSPRAALLDSLSGPKPLIGYNDAWRRITTARSVDNGLT